MLMIVGRDLHAFSQIACPEDNILNMILVRELDEETEEQTEGETKRETEIDWSVL